MRPPRGVNDPPRGVNEPPCGVNEPPHSFTFVAESPAGTVSPPPLILITFKKERENKDNYAADFEQAGPGWWTEMVESLPKLGAGRVAGVVPCHPQAS